MNDWAHKEMPLPITPPNLALGLVGIKINGC